MRLDARKDPELLQPRREERAPRGGALLVERLRVQDGRGQVLLSVSVSAVRGRAVARGQEGVGQKPRCAVSSPGAACGPNRGNNKMRRAPRLVRPLGLEEHLAVRAAVLLGVLDAVPRRTRGGASGSEGRFAAREFSLRQGAAHLAKRSPMVPGPSSQAVIPLPRCAMCSHTCGWGKGGRAGSLALRRESCRAGDDRCSPAAPRLHELSLAGGGEVGAVVAGVVVGGARGGDEGRAAGADRGRAGLDLVGTGGTGGTPGAEVRRWVRQQERCTRAVADRKGRTGPERSARG